jgi:GWxTD domain-containing protein
MATMIKNPTILLLWLVVLSLSCGAPKTAVQPDNFNLSPIYNPLHSHLHPAFTLYHNQSNISLLLIKVFPSELLFTGTIEPGKVLGSMRIDYILTDITQRDQQVTADSGSMTYRFEYENAGKKFLGQIPLKADMGHEYQLKITTTDLIRNENCQTFLFVDKTSEYSEQNFMVTSIRDNSPFFQPYVIGNTLFRLTHRNSDFDTVIVKFYGKEEPLAKASYYATREKQFLEKPDSIWVLPFGKDITYQLSYPGIYHFQLDTNIATGLSLFYFHRSFPALREVKQLVEPLIYLATPGEYDRMNSAGNQKLAVDNFWIDKAGSLGKAREALRVYYNRVYFANYYFTSFKPGWKTDRGMIYMIFGPPQTVKVLSSQEKWVYYKNNYTTSVTFTFEHTPNPFALDNYTLQRSDSFDTYWRQALESWRKGDVFFIE